MKHAVAQEPTVAALLARIRTGETSMVGVLADYLEDKELPFARSVRSIWKLYLERVEYYTRRDWSRTRWTRREALGWAAGSLRLRIGRTFRMGWKRPGLKRRRARR